MNGIIDRSRSNTRNGEQKTADPPPLGSDRQLLSAGVPAAASGRDGLPNSNQRSSEEEHSRFIPSDNDGVFSGDGEVRRGGKNRGL